MSWGRRVDLIIDGIVWVGLTAAVGRIAEWPKTLGSVVVVCGVLALTLAHEIAGAIEGRK